MTTEEYERSVQLIAEEAVDKCGEKEEWLIEKVSESVQSSRWAIDYDKAAFVAANSQNAPSEDEINGIAQPHASANDRNCIAACMAMERDVMEKCREMIAAK